MRYSSEPRGIGGVYYCGYWGYYYTVTNLQLDEYGSLKSITVRAMDSPSHGRSEWSHCTAWDRRSDRVIARPHDVSKLKALLDTMTG